MWALLNSFGQKKKNLTDCPLEFNVSLNQLSENKCAIISVQQYIQVWFGYSLLPSPCAAELCNRVDDLHCSSSMWVVFKSSRHQSELPPVLIILPLLLFHALTRDSWSLSCLYEEKCIWIRNNLYSVSFLHLKACSECSSLSLYGIVDICLSADCTSEMNESDRRLSLHWLLSSRRFFSLSLLTLPFKSNWKLTLPVCTFVFEHFCEDSIQFSGLWVGIYSSTVQYEVKVLVLHLNISTFCSFILRFHISEENIGLFTPLHSSNS